MVHGYKGFTHDMTCRGFQYEIGQTYEMDGEINPCKRGFHFCPKMADVFNYYDEKGCRYAEVEAVGKVVEYGDKSVTNKIRIIRELKWAEVLEAMYSQAGPELKSSPFPTDEIVRARENGTLDEMLPSGTEFPVTFANGEKNILVVCRDRDHTYLVTKYIMAEIIAMNKRCTNKGGWPACRMRKHVQGIYDMLPEDIRKVIVPMHIRQLAHGTAVECDDPAFLLSAVNVFGEEAYSPEADCDDRQIDIFRYPTARIKRRPGASSASWWWLRSADNYYGFSSVYSDGFNYSYYADYEGGVVVGFCIEDREARN